MQVYIVSNVLRYVVSQHRSSVEERSETSPHCLKLHLVLIMQAYTQTSKATVLASLFERVHDMCFCIIAVIIGFDAPSYSVTEGIEDATVTLTVMSGSIYYMLGR